MTPCSPSSRHETRGYANNLSDQVKEKQQRKMEERQERIEEERMEKLKFEEEMKRREQAQNAEEEKRKALISAHERKQEAAREALLKAREEDEKNKNSLRKSKQQEQNRPTNPQTDLVATNPDIPGDDQSDLLMTSNKTTGVLTTPNKTTIAYDAETKSKTQCSMQLQSPGGGFQGQLETPRDRINIGGCLFTPRTPRTPAVQISPLPGESPEQMKTNGTGYSQHGEYPGMVKPRMVPAGISSNNPVVHPNLMAQNHPNLPSSLLLGQPPIFMMTSPNNSIGDNHSQIEMHIENKFRQMQAAQQMQNQMESLEKKVDQFLQTEMPFRGAFSSRISKEYAPDSSSDSLSCLESLDPSSITLDHPLRMRNATDPRATDLIGNNGIITPGNCTLSIIGQDNDVSISSSVSNLMASKKDIDSSMESSDTPVASDPPVKKMAFRNELQLDLSKRLLLEEEEEDGFLHKTGLNHGDTVLDSVRSATSRGTVNQDTAKTGGQPDIGRSAVNRDTLKSQPNSSRARNSDHDIHSMLAKLSSDLREYQSCVVKGISQAVEESLAEKFAAVAQKAIVATQNADLASQNAGVAVQNTGETGSSNNSMVDNAMLGKLTSSITESVTDAVISNLRPLIEEAVVERKIEQTDNQMDQHEHLGNVYNALLETTTNLQESLVPHIAKSVRECFATPTGKLQELLDEMIKLEAGVNEKFLAISNVTDNNLMSNGTENSESIDSNINGYNSNSTGDVSTKVNGIRSIVDTIDNRIGEVDGKIHDHLVVVENATRKVEDMISKGLASVCVQSRGVESKVDGIGKNVQVLTDDVRMIHNSMSNLSEDLSRQLSEKLCEKFQEMNLMNSFQELDLKMDYGTTLVSKEVNVCTESIQKCVASTMEYIEGREDQFQNMVTASIQNIVTESQRLLQEQAAECQEKDAKSRRLLQQQCSEQKQLAEKISKEMTKYTNEIGERNDKLYEKWSQRMDFLHDEIVDGRRMEEISQKVNHVIALANQELVNKFIELQQSGKSELLTEFTALQKTDHNEVFVRRFVELQETSKLAESNAELVEKIDSKVDEKIDSLVARLKKHIDGVLILQNSSHAQKPSEKVQQSEMHQSEIHVVKSPSSRSRMVDLFFAGFIGCMLSMLMVYMFNEQLVRHDDLL